MKKIKNYIKEYIKKIVLSLLHDFIENEIKKEINENIKSYLKLEADNDNTSKIIEEINDIKEILKSKENNEQYISLPNENIINNGNKKEIKNGTISYDYSGNQVIERVYLDGEWLIPNNNMKEVQIVKNYVNIDKFERELDKDLVFSSDKSIVITDSLNHDDKYKIVIKSSNLTLEKVKDVKKEGF
jgi:hypothetical protein